LADAGGKQQAGEVVAQILQMTFDVHGVFVFAEAQPPMHGAERINSRRGDVQFLRRRRRCRNRLPHQQTGDHLQSIEQPMLKLLQARTMPLQ
jgi:hypothetical protein